MYLRRMLTWLKQRGMKAKLDLHALPGAQTPGQVPLMFSHVPPLCGVWAV